MSTNTSGSLTNEQKAVYYDTVAAELARVTAERNDWKIRAEEMDGYKADCHALRARVAVLEKEHDSWKEWAEEARSMFHKNVDAAAVQAARAEQAEQRNAELVAANRELGDAIYGTASVLRERAAKLEVMHKDIAVARAKQ